jgi:hypothetical protein
VVFVEPVGAGADVDTPAEEPLAGRSLETAAAVSDEVVAVDEVWSGDEVVSVDEVFPVDEGSCDDEVVPVDEVLPVDSVVPVEEVLPVDDWAPVDDGADESVADESESFGWAHASPGLLATATPTPNATANPPTRPTKCPALSDSLPNQSVHSIRPPPSACPAANPRDMLRPCVTYGNSTARPRTARGAFGVSRSIIAHSPRCAVTDPMHPGAASTGAAIAHWDTRSALLCDAILGYGSWTEPSSALLLFRGLVAGALGNFWDASRSAEPETVARCGFSTSR